jgi:hypothetical protein
MKLYNSNLAPSPRRVRIFLAEKGVSIPYVEIDLAKLDHRTPEFSALTRLRPFRFSNSTTGQGSPRRSQSAATSRRYGRSQTCLA